jgi:uncharacterized protein YdhG (YjbR/CyaY superfamily)
MPRTTSTQDRTAEVESWTDDEVAAMKERSAELKRAKRRGKGGGEIDAAAEVRAKIAEMSDADRAIAERIDEIVKANAPTLSPRTWYGMPAYARDGKVVCFFQAAAKFKSRYATFGFNEDANLDEGTMWPTSWALTTLTDADAQRIAALVKKAVS